MNHGNQYVSRKRDLWKIVHWAHDHLIDGRIAAAQGILDVYRRAYALVPASTRRRWRCGH